jgi:two-component system NtrC family sensor kinase
MNLIMNALQAMSGTGRITIATEFAGDAVVIKLTDSGPGISPENLDKIFDAGFTTKGVGVGTGLGLSISYAIVKKHHGTITVDSKTGEGTTFIITLPST